MKIKDNFIIHDVHGKKIMVDATARDFKGIFQTNATGSDILIMLRDGLDRDTVVSKMLEKYEAEREVIEKDVDGMIGKLREIGAIED